MYMYIQHLIELIIDTTCYHHEGQILIFDGQGSACLMVRTLWSDPRLIDDKIPMCVCVVMRMFPSKVSNELHG